METSRETPLLTQEDRLKFATKAAQIGIWEFDCEKKSLWRTETHDFLCGFSKMQPEWNFEKFLGILHPDDRDRVKTALTQGIKNKDHWTIHYRIIWPDQSVHWIESKGQAEKNRDGKVLKIIGANTDITEKKRIDEERIQYAAQAEVDLNNLKSEKELRERFVSTLTHDLRNPLTAIKMSAQILLRNLTDPKSADKAALRIITSVDRADRMIQDLLDANRIRANQRLSLQISGCCLVALLTNTVEDLEVIHGDRFKIRCPERIDGYWDYDCIRRVIENLANNAAKYGTPNSPITISAKQIEENVELCVHNFGGELGPKEQAKLFEPYQRITSAKTTQQKGWGIGLSLVRGIIDAHGGSITVESQVGRGTTFTAIFPLDSRQFHWAVNPH